jgi:hypothetical protein
MSTKASVIVATGLLIVVFGIGVGVGRSAQVRQLLGVMQNAKTQRHSGVERELATCQAELSEQSVPLMTTSAQAPGDAKNAKVESVAKVEALEEELKQCKTRDMVFNATMCTDGSRYFFLLLVGLHADKACVDRFGMGDLILKHSEQCAKFEDLGDPEDLDLGKISDAELSKLYDAKHFGHRSDRPGGDHKSNLTRHFKRTYHECHTKFGLSDE